MLQSNLPCFFPYLNCSCAVSCLNKSVWILLFFQKDLCQSCLLSSIIIPEQSPSSLHSTDRGCLPKAMAPKQVGSVWAACVPCVSSALFLPSSLTGQSQWSPLISPLPTCAQLPPSPVEAELDQWFCISPDDSGWEIPGSPWSVTAPDLPLTVATPRASGSNRLD